MLFVVGVGVFEFLGRRWVYGLFLGDRFWFGDTGFSYTRSIVTINILSGVFFGGVEMFKGFFVLKY